jgi:hypothetical protein
MDEEGRNSRRSITCRGGLQGEMMYFFSLLEPRC